MLRKTGIGLLTVILAAALLGGCSGGTDEGEPNDSIDRAQRISPGDRFGLRIQKKQDRDWFAVDVPGQGYLRVRAHDVPEALGLQVMFARREEWKDEPVHPIRDWAGLPRAARVPDSGTYYLQFADDYDDDAAEERFEVEVEYLEEFDPTELNDRPENAHPVEPGSVVQPALYPTEDDDWFRVSVADTGYLRVREKDVPDGIDPQVFWATYDEWADPKVQERRDWHDLPDALFVSGGREYHLQIADDYDDGESTKNFKLRVEYLEPMDPHEPNDEAERAGEIRPGDTSITAALFPRGDQDYYRLNPERDGTLQVLTSGVEGVVPEFALYHRLENGEWSEGSDWKQAPASFPVEASRAYLLRLHDDYDDQRSPEPFEFRVRWKASPSR